VVVVPNAGVNGLPNSDDVVDVPVDAVVPNNEPPPPNIELPVVAADVVGAPSSDVVGFAAVFVNENAEKSSIRNRVFVRQPPHQV
jgi:hypothetical protein